MDISIMNINMVKLLRMKKLIPCCIWPWIFEFMDIFGYFSNIGYGYRKTIEAEKVCQTVAF